VNECVWSNGGMVLTGGNGSTGREILYSVGVSWMNVYGAMMEWYWQGETEILGEKNYIVCVVGDWKCMEQWRNGTDRGKWSTWRESLYCVGGSLMNWYGAMVEWYWQGDTELLGEKNYKMWVVSEWMRMDKWWNGTDRGKQNYWERNLYNVCVVGEWMCVWSNGGIVLTRETEVLGEKHYIVWVIVDWICMEQLWNCTDRGKLKYRERNLI